MSQSRDVRIFVAAALEPVLREAVVQVRSRLDSAGGALRWVRPDDLHLTLKFLGEIAEARVAGVAAAARQVAGRTEPFEITLAGIGAFPSPRRPQVVWVGVGTGADRVTSLARDLDTELHRLKFPKEGRPFRPHLTVARARHAVPDLSAALGDLDGLVLGTQIIDALCVMQSVLRPSGAVYRPVEEVRLREAS